MPEFQAYTPQVHLCVMGSTTLICLYRDKTEWRCWSWCLVFFSTYQQQYVPVVSARTVTRYPVYSQHMCTALLRLCPFLVILIVRILPDFLWSVQLSCLWICFHVYTNYRTWYTSKYSNILLGTSVGIFLQWKKGYLYLTIGWCCLCTSFLESCLTHTAYCGQENTVLLFFK